MTTVATQLGIVDTETMTLVHKIRGLPNARYWDRKTGIFVPPLEKVKTKKAAQPAPVQEPVKPVETPEPVVEKTEDEEKDELIAILAERGIEKDRRSSLKTLRKLVKTGG